jgi:DNA replication and repair protein RecF
MVIEKLNLCNYRNYETLDLNVDSKTNILYGDNAQGKTNILEAIYICSTTKSHRGGKDKEVIKFGCDDAHIKIYINKKNKEYRIDIHLKKNKSKGIAINGIPIKKASELFGIFNVVFFSPEDLNIIKNGPSERRRFIDLELCQLDKLYVYNLLNYNKILNQRNKLLKDLYFKPDLEETLDVWDLQLAKYGSEVIKRRSEFVKKINDKAIIVVTGGGFLGDLWMTEETLVRNILEDFNKNIEEKVVEHLNYYKKLEYENVRV